MPRAVGDLRVAPSGIVAYHQPGKHMAPSFNQLLPAYKHFQIVYVGLRLGIPSALANGPLSLPELASVSKIPVVRLLRLLRGLVWAEVLSYDQNAGFGLKEEARCLLDSSPTSLSSSILFDGQFLYSAWGHLREYVENDRMPFKQANGSSIFDLLAANPILYQEYIRPMSARTSEYSVEIANLPQLSGSKKIIDIGGGDGQLVIDILKQRPGLTGIIFDLTSVASDVERKICDAGLSDRCEFWVGDMFSSVPKDGDVYFLKWVIHDWDDNEVRRILEVLRANIPSHGCLVVIERVMDEALDQALRLTQADLNMLVLGGGAERTLRQYSDLLRLSGFDLRASVPLERNYGFSALIAVPEMRRPYSNFVMNTKQLALKWFEGVWNQRNPSVIAEMMDSSAVGVTESGEIKGPEEFRSNMYEPFVRAFPDVNVAVTGIVAEGDEVAIKWTASATHNGPLLLLPTSGRAVKFTGISWLQFKNGKIRGGSDSYNLHGLIAYLSGGSQSASVRDGSR